MSFLEEFGQKIKTLRQQKRLTQEELAKKMGYTSRSTINKIEKGLIDVPQSKIEDFAKVLDVTPWDLMGWNNKEWHKTIYFRLTQQNFKMNIFKCDEDDLYKLNLKFENNLDVTMIISKTELQAFADAIQGAIK